MKKFFASKFWTNFGVAIILVIVAVGVFIATEVMSKSWQKELSDMDIALNDAAISSADAIRRDETDRTSQPDFTITGLDNTRKNKDDTVASKIFGYATTWSSSQTYMSQREHLLKQYDYLDENSQFLQEFFPPVDRVVIRDTSGALISNPLDNGLNMKFSYLLSYVMDIKDDTYSYFTQVYISSSGPAGGTSTGQFIATYDVNADGEFSNIFCYALTN